MSKRKNRERAEKTGMLWRGSGLVHRDNIPKKVPGIEKLMNNPVEALFHILRATPAYRPATCAKCGDVATLLADGVPLCVECTKALYEEFKESDKHSEEATDAKDPDIDKEEH